MGGPNLGRFPEIYNTEGNKYWMAVNENEKIVGGVGIVKTEHFACDVRYIKDLK